MRGYEKRFEPPGRARYEAAMKASLSLLLPSAALLLSISACKDDNKAKPESTPPPPAMSVAMEAKAGACASGGGDLTDAISAPYFPKTTGGYCIDPQGEVKTYGEKGKLSMEDVCTNAFDGECEVYKRFGLKRVVALRYVDGTGKGGSVEVNLSQFADPGAYGMFTFRVAAGDPAEPATPKPFAAGAAGAIGTGRAYVWRGQYVVELQYTNENESPEALAKSSQTILTAIGKEIGQRLPGPLALPAAAQILPTDKLVPNGIAYPIKDVLGWNGVGPAALGFYKDGDRRWRVLSIVKDDADAAKDAFKTIKSKPGTLPISGLGDEAAHVVLPSSGDDKSATAPKVEMLVARKGNQIWGVGDEEYALRAAEGAARDKARLTKDEAIAKLKPLLATPAPAASSAAPKGSASAAPSPSASAPKK